MTNTSEYDYLIVGQGIAGSVLALSLINQNKKTLVIDEPSLSFSSKAAAGLYNPIVFKRLVKSWRVDEVLPAADVFYEETAHFLNTHFYFKKPIVKLFVDEKEKDFWLDKTQSDAGKYLSKNILKSTLNDSGAAEVKESGYLDVSLFLETLEKFLIHENKLIKEKFDFNQLHLFENKIQYKKVTAKKIIFCEGYRTIDNPYFNWLPFKLTKGEIITIKTEELNDEQVLNKGVFILPIGNHLFKVGATYEWDNLTEVISEKGKNELIEKLNKVIAVPYQIVDHKAGIRPTVIDRRPLLGIHPNHSQLAIFNGMGTKTVMLAPFFAKQLIDFLENNIPLDIEVNINRFKKQLS